MSLGMRSALLAFAGLAVFGQAVVFDFVWDDYGFLVHNRDVHSLANIPSFFAQGTADLYRPLRTTLYAVTYQLFGLNAGLYHAMGLLFNVMAAWLVMRILELCGTGERPAFLGALVFAVHPVHIQKVVFITSVFDIPADLCLLAAVCFYLLFRQGQDERGLAKSLAFFGAGLLFAENAAAFPFIVVVLEALLPQLPKPEKKDAVRFIAGGAVIFILYLAVRTYVLGRLQRPEGEVELLSFWMSMFPVYLHYFKTLLIPYPLSPIAPLELFRIPFNTLTVLSGAVVIAFIALAWRVRRDAPLLSLGLFWFFAAILPNANLVPTGTLMAERYLYLPSIGLSFWVAAFMMRDTKVRRYAVHFLLAGFAFLSVLQAAPWQNGATLWGKAVENHPRNPTAWHNLGSHYKKKGQYDKAEEVYRTMVEKNISPGLALSELAAFEIDKGHYAAAETMLEPLVRVFPGNAKLMANMATARCQQQKPGWKDYAAQTMEQHPSAFLYEQTGNCYALAGDMTRAGELFDKALALEPYNRTVREKRDMVRKQEDR